MLTAVADHKTCLEDLLRGAKGEVEVVTRYFDDRAVGHLLRWLPTKARLSFTFGWPAQDDPTPALSAKALNRLLGAEHEVFFVPERRRLHAKVYIADGSGALVTSANLTSRGLGLKSSAANAELGLRSSDPDVLADVVQWVNGLPRIMLMRADVEILGQWLKSPFDRPPPSAPRAHSNQTLIEHALQRAQRDGWYVATNTSRTASGSKPFGFDYHRSRASRSSVPE